MTDDERWLELHRQIQERIKMASKDCLATNWQTAAGIEARQALAERATMLGTVETWMPPRLLDEIEAAKRDGRPHPGSIHATRSA